MTDGGDISRDLARGLCPSCGAVTSAEDTCCVICGEHLPEGRPSVSCSLQDTEEDHEEDEYEELDNDMSSEVFYVQKESPPEIPNDLFHHRSMPKKKNPIVAAILAILFGPLGYIYIGWKHAFLAFMMFSLFILLLMPLDFDPAIMPPAIRPWLIIPILLVLSYRGYCICVIQNDLIAENDREVFLIGSFPFAVVMTVPLLHDIAMFYAAGIGIGSSILFFSEGHILKGLLMLFLGTSFLATIASAIFGFISGLIVAPFFRIIDKAN